MGKSARVIGEEHGLTAQEMNFVLKEDGFLDGEPGDYTVTDKGKKYAGEGKTSYGYVNGNWDTRTWDDEIIDELNLTEDRKKEIRQANKIAKQKARESKKSEDQGWAIEGDGYCNEEAYTTDGDDDAPGLAVGALLVVAASAYGIYRAIPYVKRWWSEKAAPSLKKSLAKMV